jgi:hypothetical protein
MEIDPIVSLQRHFDFNANEYKQSTTAQPAADEHQNSIVAEFSLFSTGSGPAKISLIDATHPVPLVNRTRPREYYFTNPYVT